MIIRFFSIASLFVGANSAFAALTNDQPLSSTRSANDASLHHIPVDGIYIFDADTQLTPVAVVKDGRIFANKVRDGFKFSKDEPVAIQIGLSGEVVLTPVLTPEEASALPEQYILDLEALNSLRFDTEGDPNYLTQNYSAYLATVIAGKSGASRPRGHGKVGHCARYVKSKLGFAQGSVPGNGKDMYGALLNRNFHSVSCSNPSVGTVGSWRGGWHGYGHAGIWNGRCWEYDRGCLKGSPGKGYSLIGCVARGGGGSRRYASADRRNRRVR